MRGERHLRRRRHRHSDWRHRPFGAARRQAERRRGPTQQASVARGRLTPAGGTGLISSKSSKVLFKQPGCRTAMAEITGTNATALPNSDLAPVGAIRLDLASGHETGNLRKMGRHRRQAEEPRHYPCRHRRCRVANYVPYVVTGQLLVISGQLALNAMGKVSPQAPWKDRRRRQRDDGQGGGADFARSTSWPRPSRRSATSTGLRNACG